MGRSSTLQCEVQLLDDQSTILDLDKNAKGLVLFDKICEKIEVAEKDYFGLRYIDEKDGQYNWLDPLRPIKKQLKHEPYHFYFAVKFYPPNPTALVEDITRYLMVLQLREDLLKGRIQCSIPIHALLGSFVVQAEVGDYDHDEHGDGAGYLSEFKFCPKQPDEMLQKVHQFHAKHRGMTPEDAELQYLDNARKLPLYGIDLHQAADAEGQPVIIGVSAWGIHIFHNNRLINKFVWPKIVKIAFKKKKFTLTIRAASESDYYAATVLSFKLGSLRATKRLWKVGVEHHSFFRLSQADLPPKDVGFIKLGSKFRYSGRTQHQARHSQEILRNPRDFERVSSKRFSSKVLDGNRRTEDIPEVPLQEEEEKVFDEEKKDDEKPAESTEPGEAPVATVEG
ncbi:band 4.1-like protein 3 [Pocillopora verrucosa]|uniref:band 4.1-like protein 3 n=1 Tax=Pocillopora damicornis TaxID=46731 RepID=UPI000F550B87|nr:band 4.1-like protein 3 [Pocillopora damicornis]XP_058969854.1 band 4.1-like protein 3 [Pocillopora verrucosa]